MSDSDFSLHSDSESEKSSSVPRKRLERKQPDIIILDSDDDSSSDEEDQALFQRLRKNRGVSVPTGLVKLDDLSDDDSMSDIEIGSKEQLRNRKTLQDISNAPAGFKTTGLSDDDSCSTMKSPKKVPCNPPEEVTNQDYNAYIKELEKSVNKRRFPLSQIPESQVISTGRTIKPLKAWKGLWPPLREFLQNTVDHLNLMDGATGRRNRCLTMKASESGKSSTISFMCQDKDICKFIASADELVIEQNYTYPIASRSLDTGVVDTSKTSNSNQAGGFGDGFKTAAVALMNTGTKGKDFTSLKWDFYAVEEKTKVSWVFEGLTKESIATFAKCKVLQVAIKKSKMTKHDIASLHLEEGVNVNKQYVMRQEIKVKNIGKAFLEKAVPMFTVFWDLDEGSLISTKRTRGLGGDFIGPALSQPDLFNGALGSIKPKPGVYVRGIWIKNSKIKDTIMSFYGNRLEVSGRDRNEVDDDELLTAFIYVLHRCNDMKYLRALMNPLLHTGGKTDSSWLLVSPTFFNRVIEYEKEFIRHDVLRIPRGSIFVTNKTVKAKDPFMVWASDFLKRNLVPLIFIDKGSNKYLFEEASEYELTGQCVTIIKSKIKGSGKKKGTSHSVFSKFFAFLGVRHAKVIFSEDIGVAFAHDASIYIPECPMSRELIIRVLNVCYSNLEGILPENYSSLLEALLVTMKTTGRECTAEDAARIVNKAKGIRQKSKEFLHSTNSIVEEQTAKEGTTKGKRSKDLEEQSDKEGTTNGKRSKDLYETALDDLIAKKKKVNTDGSRDVVGNTAFGLDDAGDEDCLRPSSAMTFQSVASTFGGGSILCDASTVSQIKKGTFPKKNRDKLCILRGFLNEACTIIQRSIPSLHSFVDSIDVAYDGKNDSYEGFFDGQRIVINMYAFLTKLGKKESPRTMIHDFVTVVTHELAHALMPNAGHGPGWRACHMNMIMQVMTNLESQNMNE